MITDIHGNHVIQQCLELFKDKSSILYFIEQNMNSLCQDKYGCCVVQKCLSLLPDDPIINKMKQQLCDNIDLLIDHKYSNYVI